MILDNPVDDAKMLEALETLARLTRGNDEFYLLVAVIRMFHEVKVEYAERDRQRQSQPQLQLQILYKIIHLHLHKIQIMTF